MVRRIVSTNAYRRRLLRKLKKLAKEQERPLWISVYEYLSAPRRRRIAVNVGKIERLAKEGETVVVPGKVLGGGTIAKRVTVIAESFSKSALDKITRAGGRAVTLYSLAERPDILGEIKGLQLVV